MHMISWLREIRNCGQKPTHFKSLLDFNQCRLELCVVFFFFFFFLAKPWTSVYIFFSSSHSWFYLAIQIFIAREWLHVDWSMWLLDVSNVTDSCSVRQVEKSLFVWNSTATEDRKNHLTLGKQKLHCCLYSIFNLN